MSWRDLRDSIFSDSPTQALTKPPKGCATFSNSPTHALTKPPKGCTNPQKEAFGGFVGPYPGICEKVARQNGAQENRDRFPLVGPLLDDLRANGFTGAQVEYARNGDDEIGRRLLDHEIGVPITPTPAPDVMPEADCDCSACARKRTPSKTDIKAHQQAPGAPFGLTAHGAFRQQSTFRVDLDRWPSVVAWMQRQKNLAPAPDDES